MRHQPRLRRRFFAITGGILFVIAVIAMVIFKPWLLFVNKEVNEALPDTPASSAPTTSSGTSQTPTSNTQSTPVLISSGTFVSHEHSTTGKASIYRLPDGSHQLVLEGLATTTGPDVHVWLSKGPVIEGKAGWFTAGKHEHLDIAPLKGNRGNQVYSLPTGTDPSAWPSVVLWCVAFKVSFGAAALTPAG